MVDTAEILQICQFCLCEDSVTNLIVSPCQCSYHVHKICLEDWLNYRKHKKCDNCNSVFNVEARLKYTFVVSVRIWLEHPIIWKYFLTHTLLIVILNTLFTLLMGMATEHIDRLLPNGLNSHSIDYWRLAIFVMALMPATLLFLRCNVVFVGTQIVPWYRWWRSRIRYELKMRN